MVQIWDNENILFQHIPNRLQEVKFTKKQNMAVFIKNALKTSKMLDKIAQFFFSDLGFISNICSVSLQFYLKWW